MTTVEFVDNVVFPALLVGAFIAGVLIYQLMNLFRDISRINDLIHRDNHRTPISTTQKEE